MSEETSPVAYKSKLPFLIPILVLLMIIYVFIAVRNPLYFEPTPFLFNFNQNMVAGLDYFVSNMAHSYNPASTMTLSTLLTVGEGSAINLTGTTLSTFALGIVFMIFFIFGLRMEQFKNYSVYFVMGLLGSLFVILIAVLNMFKVNVSAMIFAGILIVIGIVLLKFKNVATRIASIFCISMGVLIFLGLIFGKVAGDFNVYLNTFGSFILNLAGLIFFLMMVSWGFIGLAQHIGFFLGIRPADPGPFNPPAGLRPNSNAYKILFAEHKDKKQKFDEYNSGVGGKLAATAKHGAQAVLGGIFIIVFYARLLNSSRVLDDLPGLGLLKAVTSLLAWFAGAGFGILIIISIILTWRGWWGSFFGFFGNLFRRLAGVGVPPTPPVAPPSDRRLKTEIQRIGTHRLGIGLYRWKYIEKAPNKAMEKFTVWGKYSTGVMADEVKKVMPQAVINIGGYDTVDYSMLGI